MSLKNNNNNHLNDYNLTFKHIYTQGFFLKGRKKEKERKEEIKEGGKIRLPLLCLIYLKVPDN